MVDAGVLLLLIHLGNMSRLWARAPSFLTAVTVTWWMHRSYTFAAPQRIPASIREWARFVFANAVGNGLNLAIYAGLVGVLAWGPFAALVVASVTAIVVNYGMSARWVFRRG